MKPLLLLMLLNLLLMAAPHAEPQTAEQMAHQATRLTVTGLWVPEAPPGAQVMAAFMKLHNNTAAAIRITAVSSPGFKTVEMHLSKDVDGVAKMIPQTSLTIEAESTLVLKPGSYHLMLIKPHQRFRKGDSIELNLTLDNGAQLKLNAPVKKNTGKQPAMKCGEGKCGGGKCGRGKCGG